MRAARAPVLALLAVAGGAHASQPLWEIGLGAAALSVPHYRGSEQSHSYLLPVPYAVYRGEILRANRDGARAVLVEARQLEIDISLSASPPTRSEDNRARVGMPDLPATLEIGPNLNLHLARGQGWKLDLRLPVRAVFGIGGNGGHLGWNASPVLNADLQVQGWNLGVQGGPVAATRRYHAHFYGVDAAYATAGRPAYDAQAGFGGWQFTLGASRRIGDVWLGGFVRADTLAGARFRASPLVTRRQHLAFGIAASWVLKVSEQRVADSR